MSTNLSTRFMNDPQGVRKTGSGRAWTIWDLNLGGKSAKVAIFVIYAKKITFSL